MSLIPNSTTIGCNYGYPSSTPNLGKTPVGKINLALETAIFFKNLELIGFDLDKDGFEGETFFGFLMPLRVRYRAHKRLTFEAGVVLGQDFGHNDAFNVIEPLLRLGCEPIDGVFLIAGSIIPTHWIHDAIHDDVQKLRRSVEQGLQVRTDLKRLKHDSWINWRIQEDRFTAEEFEVGSSTRLIFLDNTLWLDGQVMWAHKGGQVNVTDVIVHDITLLGGLSYGFFQPFSILCINEFRLGANYFYSNKYTRPLPRLIGRGYEILAFADTNPWKRLQLRLNASYFKGNNFLADRGDPLYGLDNYAQLGAAVLLNLPSGLLLEAGFVLQYTDDHWSNTYFINFTWGQGFMIDFLKGR